MISKPVANRRFRKITQYIFETLAKPVGAFNFIQPIAHKYVNIFIFICLFTHYAMQYHLKQE